MIFEGTKEELLKEITREFDGLEDVKSTEPFIVKIKSTNEEVDIIEMLNHDRR